MTGFREFLDHVDERNALRQGAGLPLLNVKAEIEAWQRARRERAYSCFLAHKIGPHLSHLKDHHPERWGEAQALHGCVLRIREQHRPEIEREWAEMVRDGSWATWADDG